MNLTDPFDVIHKKPLKNKAGQVVAELDYVGWSQVADRLDEACPGWSFQIVQVGEDWCWGRLTLPDWTRTEIAHVYDPVRQTFENIGYAENADADWKKEPLKDAVSDALKRCAAMAGVARYLYDKDRPQAPVTRSEPRRAPEPEKVTITSTRPVLVPAGVPEVNEDDWQGLIAEPTGSIQGRGAVNGSDECPVHHKPFKTNTRGKYCATKVGDGWCQEKGS